MSNAYGMELSATGINRPSLERITNYLMDQLEFHLREQGVENWQQVRDGSNPLYIYVQTMADTVDETAAALEQTWLQLQPQVAVGLALDAVAQLNGNVRLGSAPSIATLTLTGTAGTVIPLGTRFRGPEGHLYASDAAVTIGGGGTVACACTSLEVGVRPITAPITLVNPLVGLTSAVVSGTYSPGRLVETDAELRLRLRTRAARFVGGRGTPDAIVAGLSGVPGIIAIDVVTNTQDVEDEVGRPAHSFETIIYPEIAASLVGPVLRYHRAAGVETFGSEEWAFTNDSGRADVVRWNVADAVSIEVEITGLVVSSGTATEYHDAVKESVAAYINQSEVGETLSYTRLIAAIVAVDGVTDATLVRLRKAGGSWGSVSLTFTYREKAIIDTGDIDFIP
jgi:uncharacterized phage protein gp47/JayE